MTVLTRTRRAIEMGWESFVQDGRASPATVRPDIQRSWARVRAGSRVDPRLMSCPRAERAEDALARAEADGTLAIASEVVARFAGRLAADGHVVSYFDEDGVMLALEGNARTRGRLADVNFAPGACWAEEVAGTNGPGTALAEGRPFEVFAAEHFVQAWHPWTCVGVPVRFGGRVVGAVDVTSPWTARDASLLLAAEALAHAIEARLEADGARAQAAILLHVAQDALRARDDFLMVASHELKTPLTPLRIKVQLAQRILERAGDLESAGDVARALRGIDGYIGGLVGAVDRILDASRSVREPVWPRPERVELGATARAAVERRRSEGEAHGCALAVTAPREVIGRWDPALVGQALDHLLVNAIRYAPGRIDVLVEAGRATASVRVRDRGPGIAPEDQERIFLPYERAVSSTSCGGFGLGLHVVRQIARAHGGTARVESAPGSGSTFTVELPHEMDTPTTPGNERPRGAGEA
jgi:sigma-54 dependent transcriptional regulator, acetoin dehydrogenase operon transcriptional activator AcoR